MSAGGVNIAILVGRAVSNPVIRVTKGGISQAVFHMTTTEIWFDRETNERREKIISHRVVVYGTLVRAVEKCVSKGCLVFVQGGIETRRWVSKDGAPTESWVVEIVVQGWSGRLTVLDFANGAPARATFVEDDLDASPSDKHPDKIDTTNLPWLA